MRLFTLLLLLLALSLPAPASAGVDWDHPWLPDRMFDYRHPEWGNYDLLALFGYVTREATTTLEHGLDGSLTYQWDAVIDIADPTALPQLLELDSLSAVRNTQVVAFEARFRPVDGPEAVLDQRRLVEKSASEHFMYFDGDTVLSLIPPRDGPGRLTIHLETRSEPHPGFEDYFGGVQFIQQLGLVERRVLRLRVPDDQRLRFETRHVRVRPKERARKGVREYSFVFDHLLPSFPEAEMPASMDAWPSIIYSNQGSWQALGEIVKAAWVPHLEITPAMEAWAQELVAGIEQPSEQALAIHDAVADGWGYLGFYPGESGWVPHDAIACYDARLGDCKDRTALMVTLMRAVGLDASPCILWSGAAFARPGVPVIVANHAIAQVSLPDGRSVFLDSVDQGIGGALLREDLSGRDALVLADPPRREWIPPSPREHWLVKEVAVVELALDGSAEVRLVRDFFGQEASIRRERYAGTQRVLWERALREMLAAAYPQAAIRSISQGPSEDDPQVWRLSVELRSAAMVSRVGEFGVLAPPWLSRWSRNPPREDDRRHPQRLSPNWLMSTLEIRLPEGVEVVRRPDPGEFLDELLISSLEVSQTGGGVELALEVEEAPGVLKPGKTGARARMYRALAGWQDQSLVLRFPEEVSP